VRRIILTLAVALFSVAAPVAPASASDHSRSSHRVSRAHELKVLAIDKLQDHREMLQLETVHALEAVSARWHMTLAQFVARWQRVAICEVNGNWSMVGPYYSGIGFSNATWNHFGGTRFAPYAGLATRMEQILVGMRVTQTYIPDQYGCSPYGW
jgi:hypothetical protein